MPTNAGSIGYEYGTNRKGLFKRLIMSKYGKLWKYIKKSNKPQIILTYDEIEQIAGVPIDHSFLKYKKELSEYGYEVCKISMKARTVLFKRRIADL